MKPPYRVLYSNDTTNITTCVSPYHRRGETWRPEMLEATVDEVADLGVDAHLIQLAHGQVPWYQSRVYPIAEHHRWWRQHFGVDPIPDAFGCDGIHQYLLDGGDLLKVFVERCRARGQAPFVSLRLNDVHHVEHLHTPGNTKGIHGISRFYAEHQDCLLGSDVNDWCQRTLDWMRPEPREYMLALIEEQCEGYDIDGFELDFMRFPAFFRVDETTPEERVAVMVEFIRRVRALLDCTAALGQHRWLCARIPAQQQVYDALGIDLPQWTDAGVEMLNLSYFYFTAQDGDLAEIRRLAPEAALYAEMCHTTYVGPIVGRAGEYDNFSFRRTTPLQYATTAHAAYARGLDGVSAFNFVYTREHGDGERGPFAEPPFEVFPHLRDREWLSRQPQHYFLGAIWNTPRLPDRQLPRSLRAGESARFRLDLAPPEGGWKSGGRLRIQASGDLGSSRWRAALNGTPLTETPDHSEPYENPYPPLLGTAEQHRAWVVPAAVLVDGPNEVELSLVEGEAPPICFLDLGVS